MLGAVVGAQMMKTWILLALLTSAAPAAAAPPDPVEQHLFGLAMTCVRSSAADVERAEPTLAGAVDFLLDDLCRVEVADHDRYVANSALLAEMQHDMAPDRERVVVNIIHPPPPPPGVQGAQPTPSSGATDAETQAAVDRVTRAEREMDEGWQQMTVDPATGELHGPPMTLGVATQMARTEFDQPSAQSDRVRAAAAQAVLAARLARLAPPR